MELRLPTKIDDPILEAGVEIRFTTSYPHEAIFGLLYNKIRDKYPLNERLPIVQMPEEARFSIPALQFQPYYRFKNPQTNYVVQVGASMLSVSVLRPYAGWRALFAETNYVIEQLNSLNIINLVQRCSLKYIDVFGADIFSAIKLNISAEPFEIRSSEMMFQSVFRRGEFQCLLQLNNAVQIVMDGRNITNGSLLDLEAIRDTKEIDFFSDYTSILNAAHQAQKEIFFSLLKEDVLNTLNPTYE
jgi:uncharacterized protein (TIGR04255 family)